MRISVDHAHNIAQLITMNKHRLPVENIHYFCKIIHFFLSDRDSHFSVYLLLLGRCGPNTLMPSIKPTGNVLRYVIKIRSKLQFLFQQTFLSC